LGERHANRIGENVDAAQHPVARINAEFTSLAAIVVLRYV